MVPPASIAPAPKRSGEPARRNLQARHGADIEPAQQTERRIAERELDLPNRQDDVERVGEAVMQRMRAARDAKRAPLSCPRRRGFGLWSDAHDDGGDRSERNLL
jgi:hypothetical protein